MAANSKIYWFTDKWFYGQNLFETQQKLDSLTKEIQTAQNPERNTRMFHPRVINLTNTKFTKAQISTLALGPKYAVEKDPKQYIKDWIRHRKCHQTFRL
jgi:hypothetical protein